MYRPTNLRLRLCLLLLLVVNRQDLGGMDLPRDLDIGDLLGHVLVTPSLSLLVVAPAPSLVILLLIVAPDPGLTGRLQRCLRLYVGPLLPPLWLRLRRLGPLPRLRPGLRPGGLRRRGRFLCLMPLLRVVVRRTF